MHAHELAVCFTAVVVNLMSLFSTILSVDKLSE